MLPAVAIDALVDHVVEACEADAVQVDALGIAAAALADAESVRWSGDPCRRHPTLRAELVSGHEVVARLTVRPSLTGQRTGPVAATDLSVGDPVAWSLGPVPLDARLVEHPDGLATRSVAAGQPLLVGSVRPAPDVLEGSEVTIVVHRGSLALSVPGTLLRDGTVGAPVHVRNDVNHVALTGVLTAPDRVEIR